MDVDEFIVTGGPWSLATLNIISHQKTIFKA